MQNFIEQLQEERKKSKEENRKKNDETLRLIMKVNLYCDSCTFKFDKISQADHISIERFCHVNDKPCIDSIDGCWKPIKRSLNKKLKKIRKHG